MILLSQSTLQAIRYRGRGNLPSSHCTSRRPTIDISSYWVGVRAWGQGQAHFTVTYWML